jgi:hypothetical protein
MADLRAPTGSSLRGSLRPSLDVRLLRMVDSRMIIYYDAVKIFLFHTMVIVTRTQCVAIVEIRQAH